MQKSLGELTGIKSSHKAEEKVRNQVSGASAPVGLGVGVMVGVEETGSTVKAKAQQASEENQAELGKLIPTGCTRLLSAPF